MGFILCLPSIKNNWGEYSWVFLYLMQELIYVNEHLVQVLIAEWGWFRSSSITYRTTLFSWYIVRLISLGI